jgi:hypothetical protein
MQRLFTAFLVGGDQRHRQVICDGRGNDPRKDPADHERKEHLAVEHRQTFPVHLLGREDCQKILPQIAPGTAELFTQRQMGGGARPNPQQRGKDIAPHDPRDQPCDDEMQAKERGEGREHPRPDPACDLFGGIGQPADPVFDIFERAHPAATRPQCLNHGPPQRPPVSAFENHLPSFPVRPASGLRWPAPDRDAD